MELKEIILDTNSIYYYIDYIRNGIKSNCKLKYYKFANIVKHYLNYYKVKLTSVSLLELIVKKIDDPDYLKYVFNIITKNDKHIIIRSIYPFNIDYNDINEMFLNNFSKNFLIKFLNRKINAEILYMFLIIVEVSMAYIFTEFDLQNKKIKEFYDIIYLALDGMKEDFCSKYFTRLKKAYLEKNEKQFIRNTFNKEIENFITALKNEYCNITKSNIKNSFNQKKDISEIIARVLKDDEYNKISKEVLNQFLDHIKNNKIFNEFQILHIKKIIERYLYDKHLNKLDKNDIEDLIILNAKEDNILITFDENILDTIENYDINNTNYVRKIYDYN